MNRRQTRAAVFAWLLLALGMLIAAGIGQARADIPRAALQYRADLVRIAHAEWGLDAPVAGSYDRLAVDAACGQSRRAAVHCRENLGYPRRILLTLQSRYLAWGRGVAA